MTSLLIFIQSRLSKWKSKCMTRSGRENEMKMANDNACICIQKKHKKQKRIMMERKKYLEINKQKAAGVEESGVIMSPRPTTSIKKKRERNRKKKNKTHFILFTSRATVQRSRHHGDSQTFTPVLTIHRYSFFLSFFRSQKLENASNLYCASGLRLSVFSFLFCFSFSPFSLVCSILD